MLDEVVRRVRLPSAAPVRLLEPALGQMAFMCGLVPRSVAPLAVLG